uniref:Uncharacterized protein n=1 Tax=Cannabis sativa TaxID=3483 RepID=A0A803Q7P3_CANSA
MASRLCKNGLPFFTAEKQKFPDSNQNNPKSSKTLQNTYEHQYKANPNNRTRDDLMPKILALEEVDKAKEATQKTEAVNPRTTIPIGENVDDFALLISEVAILTSSTITEVSSDIQTKDAKL